jgi:spore coat protein U-like protein
MKDRVSTLISSALLAFTSSTYAATGLLDIKSSVGNVCTISSGAKIDFGLYRRSHITTGTTGTSLNVECSYSDVAWRIYSTQSVETRLMTRENGTETLRYTLSNSQGIPLATSDTTLSQTSDSESGIGSAVVIIQGEIAAGQNDVPGHYTQRIPLTIVF